MEGGWRARFLLPQKENDEEFLNVSFVCLNATIFMWKRDNVKCMSYVQIQFKNANFSRRSLDVLNLISSSH